MDTPFDKEDRRHYISLLQENINRMSKKSANCRSWTIAIVTAIMTLSFSNIALRDIIWIAIIPIILFYILDSYYLGMERRFIKIEQIFIDKIRANREDVGDYYYFSLQSIDTDFCASLSAALKWSMILIYWGLLSVVLLIVLLPCFN